MVEAVFGARREPWSGRPLGTRCVVYIYYIRVKELRRVGEEGSPTTIRHCCVLIFLAVGGQILVGSQGAYCFLLESLLRYRR